MALNSTGQTFVLNQKLMSISGDLWIDDADGNHAFEVDGKALALRRTLVLLDQTGQPLYEINQSLAHLHHTFEIKRGDEVVATVQKALLNILGVTHMASLTLVEAAKIQQNPLIAGIIESIVTVNHMYQHLPFDQNYEEIATSLRPDASSKPIT